MRPGMCAVRRQLGFETPCSEAPRSTGRSRSGCSRSECGLQAASAKAHFAQRSEDAKRRPEPKTEQCWWTVPHEESTGEAAPPQFPVHENGLSFLVRAYDGFSTGLFLDQRENRRRVRELASGKRVLNLFAYTCGFSVAAAAGGAAQTVSVDASVKHLESLIERLGRYGTPTTSVILSSPVEARAVDLRAAHARAGASHSRRP